MTPALHRPRRAGRQEPGQGRRRAQAPDRRLARPVPPTTVQARRPAPARSCLGKLPLLSGRLTAPHGIEKPRQLPRTLCAHPSAEKRNEPTSTTTGTTSGRPPRRCLTNRPRSKRKQQRHPSRTPTHARGGAFWSRSGRAPPTAWERACCWSNLSRSQRTNSRSVACSTISLPLPYSKRQPGPSPAIVVPGALAACRRLFLTSEREGGSPALPLGTETQLSA